MEALLRHHENQEELSSGTEVPGTQEGPTRDETPLSEPGTSELRGRAKTLGSGELLSLGKDSGGGNFDIRLLNSLPTLPHMHTKSISCLGSKVQWVRTQALGSDLVYSTICVLTHSKMF